MKAEGENSSSFIYFPFSFSVFFFISLRKLSCAVKLGNNRNASYQQSRLFFDALHCFYLVIFGLKRMYKHRARKIGYL